MPTFSLASQPPAEEKAKDKPSPYPVGELYRQLRKNVLAQVTASPAAMAWICPTGSEPLAEHLVGLASALAETCDGEILLVDANFQSSALTKRFNLNEKHGLADLLTKKLAAQAAGHETAVARVRVLPKGGDGTSRASRRASEEEWKSLLAGLKERYRYVLIEAPGVEEPHCIPLSKAADATFIAVALDHTPRETVQEALEHLHLHRARVAGCVVTEAPRSTWGTFLTCLANAHPSRKHVGNVPYGGCESAATRGASCLHFIIAPKNWPKSARRQS
jgi:Mrp family chromosome partitioning ATPase